VSAAGYDYSNVPTSVGVNRSHVVRARVLRRPPHVCGGELATVKGRPSASKPRHASGGEPVTPNCWGIRAAEAMTDTGPVGIGVHMEAGTGVSSRRSFSRKALP